MYGYVLGLATGLHSNGRLQALHLNIRQKWKLIEVANILVYYGTATKSYIAQVPCECRV